jgi:hypothetical protein
LKNLGINTNFVGIVFAVVGVAQDVTEDRKHAQVLREMQYIRASQEAKVETERNMTAYFAHELRNRKSVQRCTEGSFYFSNLPLFSPWRY